MTYPTLLYPDNETAARAVYGALRELRPPIRHLMLQRAAAGQPAYDTWWLLPATVRVPHAHGRLALRRVPGSPGRMSAGFSVTRGLGQQVAELTDPDLVMDGRWFWRSRFMGDVFASVLESPLHAVMARADQAVTLAVELTRFDNLPDPGMGLGPPSRADDRLVFRVREEGLTLSPLVLPEEELSPLTTAPTLRDLVLWIEGVPDLWWAWVTLHLGVQVAYGGETASPGAPDVWDAGALWQRALDPWLPWVH